MTMQGRQSRPAAPLPPARYEYEHAETFAELKRLAAEGWRLAAVAAVSRTPGYAETVYVVERPAGCAQ